MKYMIYEDSVTHKFGFLPLPDRFGDGDPLPVVTVNRWFDSHTEAIAALPELFDRDEIGPAPPTDEHCAIEDSAAVATQATLTQVKSHVQ